MDEKRWIGVLILALGMYFVVCSLWARNFVLSQMKIRRITNIFGEVTAHRFYALMGFLLVGAGIVRVLGVY